MIFHALSGESQLLRKEMTPEGHCGNPRNPGSVHVRSHGRDFGTRYAKTLSRHCPERQTFRIRPASRTTGVCLPRDDPECAPFPSLRAPDAVEPWIDSGESKRRTPAETGMDKDHRCGAAWAQCRLAFPTTIPQPQDRIRTILAPNLSHGGVSSGPTRRTGHHSNTACAKNSNSHLHSGIHPLQYTDLGEEVDSWSQPPGPHRRGETRPEALGLQSRSRHAADTTANNFDQCRPHIPEWHLM